MCQPLNIALATSPKLILLSISLRKVSYGKVGRILQWASLCPPSTFYSEPLTSLSHVCSSVYPNTNPCFSYVFQSQLQTSARFLPNNSTGVQYLLMVLFSFYFEVKFTCSEMQILSVLFSDLWQMPTPVQPESLSRCRPSPSPRDAPRPSPVPTAPEVAAIWSFSGQSLGFTALDIVQKESCRMCSFCVWVLLLSLALGSSVLRVAVVCTLLLLRSVSLCGRTVWCPLSYGWTPGLFSLFSCCE